ncbi:MAG: substrate-binding domain-containing protein [Deltaproteobacteria bacterium]|nr:substrate-binding domain-containing protein [Candidatus Anaeroferrophillus wilburensis]MBN2887890.1 substrate-binding domain-containing protein [Deltaproteobacteria bacterium]
MKRKLLLVVAALLLSMPTGMAMASSARDYISIVGSSTVYPFATVVAEQFGKTTNFKTPKIESTGSGGGLKLFAAGIGVQHPDITNASRRIKKSEYELCQKNGIKDIVEIKIGYDGIVVANAKAAPTFHLSSKDLFLALAKEVPNPAGGEQLIANPYTTWKQIDANLPNIKIRVLGPPPTSGTRDAFVELAMESGAKSIAWLSDVRKKDKKRFTAIAHTIREDGVYVEAGENDNLIVQKLEADHDALGIFGFSFLDQNADRVQGSFVDNVEPTFANIADSSYPVSRALYFYVKKAHVDVIPGMRGYLEEFSSEKAWGEEGYLSERGLIPMPKAERDHYRRVATELLPVLSADDFK